MGQFEGVMPQSSPAGQPDEGRLLTDEITKILEVWQDTDTDYVVSHSFSGVAHEVSQLFQARIEALIEEIEYSSVRDDSAGWLDYTGNWPALKAKYTSKVKRNTSADPELGVE